MTKEERQQMIAETEERFVNEVNAICEKAAEEALSTGYNCERCGMFVPKGRYHAHFIIPTETQP